MSVLLLTTDDGMKCSRPCNELNLIATLIVPLTFCDVICDVQFQKISIPPMDGLGNSEGEGDLIIENVQREGGLVVHHNFPEGFLSKK